MKCPSCYDGDLVQDTRDIEYSYQGEDTVIPQISGRFCNVCDESIFNDAEGEKLNAAMLEFNKTVNARFVDPAFILNVRTKLGLGQREAAELFGGGVNAFSRYETGRARPPKALVQLLQILDRHPHLLSEIAPDVLRTETLSDAAPWVSVSVTSQHRNYSEHNVANMKKYLRVADRSLSKSARMVARGEMMRRLHGSKVTNKPVLASSPIASVGY